jgi:hypothetical protein
MKNLKVIVGILISLIFIYVVFRNVNIKQVLDTFLRINYILIVPAIIVQVSSYWVRSIRWSIMLSGIKKIKVSRLFAIISISYALNNTLPLRAGDIARAYLIGEREGISKTAAFSTVILEKIYDGIMLLLFLGTISLLFPFPSWVKSIGIATSIIFLCALLFIIFLVAFRKRTMAVTEFFLKVAPEKLRGKIIDILGKFIDGLDIIKNRKNLLPIAVSSVIIWTLEAYMIYAIANAFGFSNTVYMAIFTLVIVNLGIMVPSSPGYIGAFEYFCIKSLSLFNITKEVALGLALIFRVAEITPITIIGYIYLVKEGVSLSSLTASGKKAQ